jgi:hypothetical protein
MAVRHRRPRACWPSRSRESHGRTARSNPRDRQDTSRPLVHGRPKGARPDPGTHARTPPRPSRATAEPPPPSRDAVLSLRRQHRDLQVAWLSRKREAVPSEAAGRSARDRRALGASETPLAARLQRHPAQHPPARRESGGSARVHPSQAEKGPAVCSPRSDPAEPPSLGPTRDLAGIDSRRESTGRTGAANSRGLRNAADIGGAMGRCSSSREGEPPEGGRC